MIPYYLATDLETTGLDPAKDRIIELAAIVLTEDFTEIGTFEALIACPRAAFEGMSDYVLQMHLKSGLLFKGAAGIGHAQYAATRHLDEVETDLLEICRAFPEPPILAGHSVQFDRGMLTHWMPHVAAALHYRNLDARTCELLAPKREHREPPHRALADIRRSVDVLRAARARLQVGGTPL